MFKLTKDQEAKFNRLSTALREAYDELTAAVNAYNQEASNARDFASEVAGDWESDYDSKSDRWRESDKASEVQDLVSQWQEVDIPDLDEPDETPINDFEGLSQGVE